TGKPRSARGGGLAVGRPVEAREEGRERARAGRRRAEECVHLPGGGLEVDALVRNDAREALRDPARRDGGRRRGAVGAPPFFVGRCHLPVGLPITPFTSQLIEYRSLTVMRFPFGTRNLPLWSYSGPENS